MWDYNRDLLSWSLRKDTLSIDNYQAIKQSLSATRLYAKCFSGALWIETRDLDNLFPTLEYLSYTTSWHYSTGSGTYCLAQTHSTGSTPITPDSFTHYSNYLYDYAWTQRGSFSPKREIDLSITPQVVDLVSTKSIDITGTTFGLLSIDGVFLKEGQRVLLKDQKTEVGLSSSVDTTLFEDNYYLISDDGSTKRWFYYNNQNGIYRYSGGNLIKEELSTITHSSGLLIGALSGQTNRDKNFGLERNRSGEFPVEGQNSEFTGATSSLVKYKFEYNNLFEVGYRDILKHESLTIGTYSIPERVISVGDFGTILIYQSGNSNVLRNKISTRLTSIEDTRSYYWICGHEATLLKIDKITLDIEYIQLDTYKNFKNISFFSDLYGCVVGEWGQIWITENGGLDWQSIQLDSIYNNITLNCVKFFNIGEIYISGNSGTFFRLLRVQNEWQGTLYPITRFDSLEENYEIKPHLNKFIYMNVDGWTLSGQKSSEKEFFLISSESENLFIWPKSDFFSYSYLVLDPRESDIQTHTLASLDSRVWAAGNNFYTLDLLDYNTSTASGTNVLFGPTLSTVSTSYYNSFRIWQGLEFIIASNFSLSRSYSISPFTQITDYAKLYTDGIDSKFLILNYDIASKVNFHDYLGNYRLPNPATFSVSGFTGTDVNITSLNGQKSWIDYWKKTLLTFEYYTSFSQSNVVEISTLFNWSSATNSFYVSPDWATPSLSDQNIDPDPSKIYIKKLVPTTKFDRDSYYVEGSDPIDISFATNYNVWIDDFIIVFKLTNAVFDDTPFKKGDILHLQSPSIEANLMVNKIFRYMSSNPTPIFLYCYHNFGQDIISTLRETGFTITNINVWSDADSFVDGFNKHPLSLAWGATISGSVLEISPKLNNVTAYHNLASSISSSGVTQSSVYKDTFFDFGYTPTYNLVDFLSVIDPVAFTWSKVFSSMPLWQDIPALDVDLESNWTYSVGEILCDDTRLSNRLVFGPGLEFIWNSIWVNTFMDIVIKTSNYGNFITRKCLVSKKYYWPERNSMVIEFNKPINRELLQYNQATQITQIDLLSRNTLSKISSDLQELNNINKSLSTKNIQETYTFDILENEISQKFPTDSYAKILLTDPDIKSKITAIIFEDSQSTLSTRLINPLGDDLLKILPADLSTIGTDKLQKEIIELDANNLKIIGMTASLVDVDPQKLRFRFVDGLTLNRMFEKWSWMIESEVSNGLVGENNSGLIFYSGVWKCGRWFGGTWHSGEWLAGDWYDGEWNSNSIVRKNLEVLVDPTQNLTNSIWYGGRWFDGVWQGGTWQSGRRYAGDWNGGIWNGGIWNDGLWNRGTFRGGVWVDGRWESGKFNSDSNPSYWLDGEFRGGDFENGRWFDGEFSQYNSLSTFGTRASGGSKAIWETGNWISGDFYSGKSTDSSGTKVVSDIHKWAIFKSGDWAGGNFWGGIALNINFKSGTFWGGVVDDIEVIGLTQSGGKMHFLLNGLFLFRYPYDIWMYSTSNSQYSSFGTFQNPKKYLLVFSGTNDKGQTLVQVTGSYSFTPVWESYTDLRVVSHFENATFKSGLWYGGIFRGNNFEGGMWYSGHFNGNFGL